MRLYVLSAAVESHTERTTISLRPTAGRSLRLCESKKKYFAREAAKSLSPPEVKPSGLQFLCVLAPLREEKKKESAASDGLGAQSRKAAKVFCQRQAH